MNRRRKYAIALIALTSALSVALASASAEASEQSSASTWAPTTTSECARLPLSQRGICASAVSVKRADATAPAEPRDAVGAQEQSAHAQAPGQWFASEAVDAQFASTFRSAVQACNGPFQIQLVDEPPQHEIRFRCIPR